MAIFQYFKNVLFILCFWFWCAECCVHLRKNSHAKILAYNESLQSWAPLSEILIQQVQWGVQESAYVINIPNHSFTYLSSYSLNKLCDKYYAVLSLTDTVVKKQSPCFYKLF